MQVGTVKQIWRYAIKSMAGEQLKQCSVGTLGIPGDRGWALRNETTGELTNAKAFPFLMQCSARYREAPANGLVPPAEMRFPDGFTANTDQPDINQILSERLGKAVTLWPLQPADNVEHYRRRSRSARVLGRLARYGAFRAALPTITSFGKPNAELRKMFSRDPGEPIPDISILPPELVEFTSPPGTYFDAFPINILTTASLDTMKRLNPAAQWDVRRFRPNFLIETPPDIQSLVESEWCGRTLRIGTVELQCDIPTMRCGMTMHAQEGLEKDPSILRSIVKDANQNLGVYARVTEPGEVRIGDSVTLS
ncbi:MAG: MOSC domain-containing protein [Acidobacteria bacterium]|nr:MAG: MOSC domain-containing protein [Acidobacteriota bacterium]